MLVRVINPHHLKFHYKDFCPYCRRVDKYILTPLEEMGIIVVERCDIEDFLVGKDLAANRRIGKAFGKPKGLAPLVLDVSCTDSLGAIRYYWVPHNYGSRRDQITRSIREVAVNLIDHLCKTVKVEDSDGEKRYLSQNDVMRNEIIKKLMRDII